MKKSEFKNQIKEDIYSILKEGQDPVVDVWADASDISSFLEEIIFLRKDDNNFLTELADEFTGLNNLINRNFDLDENSSKDQEDYNDELEKTVDLEKEISKAKKDGDMNEGEQSSQELIKKGLDIINDDDEYATSDWKYQEYEKIILSLAKLKGLNEDVEDDTPEPSKAQVNKKDSVATIANKLGETKKEMQSVLKKFKAAEEGDKPKFVERLKALTKIKKELESLL